MTGVATQDVTAPIGTKVRINGVACLVAGSLGAASGIFLAVYPSDASDDTWRYPLSPDGFAAIQVWFGIQHLGLLAGIVALLGSGLVGTARAGRLGVWLAVAGMALLTATELLAVTARHAALDQFTYLNALYGVASLLSGVGLFVAGVTVRHDGRLRGWQRWVVLVSGIWVFVPMTPAIAAGFLTARLAITGWMLLFAALGWTLWRLRERS